MPSFLHRTLLLLVASLTVATSRTLETTLVSTLSERQDSQPAPLAIAPDQNWDGIDGKWSSFTLRVGTPQQFVRTFVSFQVYQTWVIMPLGCTRSNNVDSCADSRGWLFDNETSSTFDYQGLYNLAVGENLDIVSNGITGYEKVGLSGEGENGPTLDNTTVTAIASNAYYIGMFGINPKPTNLSDFDDMSPSYMTQLKQQGLIPSVSFGYTAGAKYRFTGTFASLTLGGYDTSKYEANNVTFLFNPDNEHDTMVAVQSISTPSLIDSNPVATELLPNPVYALIDSTQAEFWLPIEACQVFEYEFGLVYDNATELYLINDTHHEKLVERNASITLKMGQGLDSEETVSITLPYAAFDLQASPPYQLVRNESYYFPLRRGNASQYTLGRTFLQEAYIIVDYEVSRFQLAQNVWDQTAEANIVAIPPANASQDDSLWTSPNWNNNDPTSRANSGSGGSSSSDAASLSAGAIAGIVVGAVAVIALIGAFIFFYLRRQKRKRASAAAAAAAAAASSETKPGSSGESTASQGKGDIVYPKAELAGSSPFPFGMTHHDLDQKGLSPHDAPRTPTGNTAYSPTSAGEGTFSSGHTLISPTSEADSKQVEIFEMPGDMPAVREKDGKQLSEKEALQHRERVYNGVDSTAVTPTTPAGTHDHTTSGAQDPDVPARRTVNAEDIVDARTGEAVSGRHRAFSFEGERGTHDSG